MKYRVLIIKSSLLILSIFTLYFLLVKLGYIFPIQDTLAVTCINGCSSYQAIHEPVQKQELLNYDKTLKQVLGEIIDKSKTSILIEKSKYRLTLYYDKKPVKSYPVVFGSAPEGDKFKEGDRKTPEGIYRIKDLYPHPSWSKFIWLDYPNAASWRKHLQAKMDGKISWLNTVGGEVGIHGVPQGNDELINDRNNWTWGCPSMKNSDVDELYGVVKVGTLVEIIP